MTSIEVPGLANAGSLAVTMTAATFFAVICLGSRVRFTPIRFIMLIKLWIVNGAPTTLSPVVRKPLTNPYPINWFSRTPSMLATSLMRDPSAWVVSTTTGKPTDSTDRSRRGQATFLKVLGAVACLLSERKTLPVPFLIRSE